MVRAHTDVNKPSKHGGNRLRILTAPPVNIKDFASSIDSLHQQHSQANEITNLSDAKSKLKTEADEVSCTPGDGPLTGGIGGTNGQQSGGDGGQPNSLTQRQSLHLGGKSLRSFATQSAKYRSLADDKSCRDFSITQHAIIDDDNASQHQTPKYQGALTLASQWKSQFDDSDDSTDGLWKGDQHSENASKKNIQLVEQKQQDQQKQQHKQNNNTSTSAIVNNGTTNITTTTTTTTTNNPVATAAAPAAATVAVADLANNLNP